MFFWRVGLPDGVFWDPNDLLFVLPPENDFFRLKRPETDFDVHVKIRFWPNSAERLTLESFLGSCVCVYMLYGMLPDVIV